MSEQQYTTPEKPAGYRSYPENLRYYADHFDKYRMWADSGMTRAMRQSAEDVETLRARVAELEAAGRRITARRNSDDGFTVLTVDVERLEELLANNEPFPAPVSAVPDDVADELLQFLTHSGFNIDDKEERTIRAMLAAKAKENK